METASSPAIPSLAIEPPDRQYRQVWSMADAVAGLLGVAEALGATGRPIDLAGLDALTGRLCAAALDLSPEDGRKLRPDLSSLLERLDRLELAMTGAPP